jgi:hypothetical protein
MPLSVDGLRGGKAKGSGMASAGFPAQQPLATDSGRRHSEPPRLKRHDAFLAGFAVRGRELVVYLIAENPEQVDRLAKLRETQDG